MNDVYTSIVSGLQEAIEDAKDRSKKLPRRTVTIDPVKQYHAEEIHLIRKKTGLSQRLFAAYLGVSPKTVEAWEAGINYPSGPSSRILSMMEMDEALTERFPFVTQVE